MNFCLISSHFDFHRFSLRKRTFPFMPLTFQLTSTSSRLTFSKCKLRCIFAFLDFSFVNYNFDIRSPTLSETYVSVCVCAVCRSLSPFSSLGIKLTKRSLDTDLFIALLLIFLDVSRIWRFLIINELFYDNTQRNSHHSTSSIAKLITVCWTNNTM